MKLKFSKLRDVKSPIRGTDKSAGIDFFVPNDFGNRILAPCSDMLIPSGIKMKIPKGYMLMAADKSGVVTSKNACVNAGRKPKKDAFDSIVIIGAKIVDEDYQGEIHIHLINCGDGNVIIKSGMKIAQFILVPVLYATPEEVPLSELFDEVTERSDGAFGHTGSY